MTSLIVFVVFRFIDYIPTFSGEPLHCINILTVITAVIISSITTIIAIIRGSIIFDQPRRLT